MWWMASPKFKPYVQDQPFLLPPSLDDLIGPMELVRVVDALMDQLDWVKLLKKVDVEAGGTSIYDPRMMAKVLVFAYSQRMLSCRQIAKALRQNIHFMWLSGMSQPSYATINRFRSDYLKGLLQDIFAEVMKLLLASKHVRAEEYFVDGTKMEANAHRSKVLFKKNIDKWAEACERRARELFREIDELNQKEDQVYGGADLPERGHSNKPLDSNKIKEAAQRIDEQLAQKPPASPKAARQLGIRARRLTKEAEQLAKYEAAKEQLGGRNNCSMTDKDAAVMPMKQSAEFRPAYNLQISAEAGFVTGFSLGTNSNDGASLKGHLEAQEKLGLPTPGKLVADAGYGHEQVYEQLQDAGIEAVVKHKDYAREKLTRGAAAYHKTKFTYDAARDAYTCPQGRLLEVIGQGQDTLAGGYTRNITHYRCASCEGCPARALCLPQPDHAVRTLSVSHKLEAHLAATRHKLASEEGRALYRRRSHEVETVFGDMKANQGFRRFRMRGLAKNTLDLAIYFTAHNLRKIWTKKLHLGTPLAH